MGGGVYKLGVRKFIQSTGSGFCFNPYFFNPYFVILTETTVTEKYPGAPGQGVGGEH